MGQSGGKLDMQRIVKTLILVVAITFFALAVPRVQAHSAQIIAQTSGYDLTKLPTTIFATEKGFFTGILTGKLGSTSSHNTTLPERATLLLLGGSLAGLATGARRRATRLKRADEVSARVPSE
jgi:hypothetical protein